VRPLRILYVAIDQTVPGTLGGSVHVHAVAEGLSRLGHEVHVAVRQGGPWPAGRVIWHDLSAPFGKPALRWLKRPAVANLARSVRPNLVMERYYNFGGEGVWAARALGVPSVLEVNAPVIDHPGSRKAQFDRLLLVKPMERWRNRLVKDADLFVTPSASILPDWLDASKVLEVEWGADVDAFTPGAAGTTPVERDPSRVTCVFVGAFRSWHGADILARALARLHAKGDTRFGGLFVGEGPERGPAEREAAGIPGVRFTGALPHTALPATLARVDIGVAPFEPSRHPPLELGFYWSPLKIFEYMAAGLPVVAPSLPRLRRLVQHGHEGWLYDPSDPVGLDKALVALADATVRRRLGAAARARAVRDFSWTAHCAALDARLRRLVHA
jgi:glycosyltransferase involved in cell wall biosynthesis